MHRGPQGIYAFTFQSASTGVTSTSSYTFLQSQAATLKVLGTTMPPAIQQVGIQFSTQPVVQVFDINGNPANGKYVTAFTWPEPIFNGFITTNKMQGQIIILFSQKLFHSL